MGSMGSGGGLTALGYGTGTAAASTLPGVAYGPMGHGIRPTGTASSGGGSVHAYGQTASTGSFYTAMAGTGTPAGMGGMGMPMGYPGPLGPAAFGPPGGADHGPAASNVGTVVYVQTPMGLQPAMMSMASDHHDAGLQVGAGDPFGIEAMTQAAMAQARASQAAAAALSSAKATPRNPFDDGATGGPGASDAASASASGAQAADAWDILFMGGPARGQEQGQSQRGGGAASVGGSATVTAATAVSVSGSSAPSGSRASVSRAGLGQAQAQGPQGRTGRRGLPPGPPRPGSAVPLSPDSAALAEAFSGTGSSASSAGSSPSPGLHRHDAGYYGTDADADEEVPKPRRTGHGHGHGQSGVRAAGAFSSRGRTGSGGSLGLDSLVAMDMPPAEAARRTSRGHMVTATASLAEVAPDSALQRAAGITPSFPSGPVSSHAAGSHGHGHGFEQPPALPPRRRSDSGLGSSSGMGVSAYGGAGAGAGAGSSTGYSIGPSAEWQPMGRPMGPGLHPHPHPRAASPPPPPHSSALVATFPPQAAPPHSTSLMARSTHDALVASQAQAGNGNGANGSSRWDVETLAQRAVQRGLCDGDDALTWQDFDILFRPILAGFKLWKHGRSGPAKHHRFWMNASLTRLHWDTTKLVDLMRTGERHVDMADVVSLVDGVGTDLLRKKLGRGEISTAGAERCFSLVTTTRTLDLQAESVSQRRVLVRAFNFLVRRIARAPTGAGMGGGFYAVPGPASGAGGIGSMGTGGSSSVSTGIGGGSARGAGAGAGAGSGSAGGAGGVPGAYRSAPRGAGGGSSAGAGYGSGYGAGGSSGPYRGAGGAGGAGGYSEW